MTELNTILCTIREHSIYSILALVLAVFLGGCQSGDKKSRPSPLTGDSLTVSGRTISIIYSSPAVRDREIWGKLDPYNKVWRIGANEATIFETGHDLMIGDSLLLPKGKYSLFTIPREGDWTIIFNKEWNQWGAYNYDPARDQLRFDLTPAFVPEMKERLTFDITEDNLHFHWEYLQFDIPFSIR